MQAHVDARNGAVTPRRAIRRRGTTLLLLALLALGGALPVRALDPGAEEANCRQVEAVTVQKSSGILDQMTAMAEQLFGRPISELSEQQMMQVALAISRQKPGAVKDPFTAADEQRRRRCDAYQAWRGGHLSVLGAVDSVKMAAGTFLWIWGNESLRGDGCSCPGYQLGSEDSTNGCEQPVVCNGRGDRMPIPDVPRGCRTLLASRWLLGQQPALLRSLAVPADLRRPGPSIPGMESSGAGPLPASCLGLAPPAADLDFAQVAASVTSGPGAALKAADAASGRCYRNPEPQVCQQAADLTTTLTQAAARAGDRTCLVYAQIARSLWTLAGNPEYTYLLTTFPEASRLRNEARIALRYVRTNCRRV